MNRSPCIRATGLLLALGFFLGIGADAYGLHGCPHHDGEASAAAADGAHGDGAPPLRLAVDRADGDGSGDPDGRAGPCTCVGSCHGTAATPLPAALPAAAPDHGPARQVRAGPTDTEPHPRSSLYLLPLANAPPTRG